MTVLVTGAAGFIGFHVARALLDRGERVVGIDNLNDYYDVALKEARVGVLAENRAFAFEKGDIADAETVDALLARHRDVDRVAHFAAQAGVRYSLVNPHAYVRANVAGHVTLLEACRRLDRLRHVVYASSSSVYGGNVKLPFSVADRVDSPLSLYAATKRSMEMISHCYGYVHRIPQTGLRFFTVYGPWGRPDMAAFIFTRRILAGEKIEVFNHGDMRRDFTYIDDVVAGVLGCLERPPDPDGAGVPCRLYNLGNHRSEPLMRFIAVLETALGRKAEIELRPLQVGDVKETYAEIEDARRDFGFDPKVSIDEGVPRFVRWYRDFYGL